MFCWLSAWIGNQATLFTFLLSPLSASLVTRWGVRPVVITGAALFSAGMFLTAATNKIWQAVLTYGVMGGLGGTMIYTPTIGSVPTYFKQRKALAVCMSQSGRWFGSLALVAIMTPIRDAFGWRTQCVFLGGIGFLMILMGILFRPRPPMNATKQSFKNIAVQSCHALSNGRFAIWVSLLSLHFFQVYIALFHLVSNRN